MIQNLVTQDQLDEVNNNLSALMNYTNTVLIGTVDGKNLYRRQFVYQNMSIPLDTTVIINSNIGIAPIKIKKISGVLKNTTYCISNGGALHLWVDGNSLKIYQTYSNVFSSGASIELEVEFYD